MSEAVEIRRLWRADVPLLEPLWSSLVAHHREVQPAWYWRDEGDEIWKRRRKRYEDWLAQEDSLLLVAFRGGRPVGYAVAHAISGHGESMHFGERIAQVESFAMLEEERSRGAGKLLLDAVAEHFAELGVETLALGVLSSNEAARRFYEREGFEAVMMEMVRRPRGDL